MFDGELFGQQMVEIVRGYMVAELEPVKAENARLLARIDVLEQREIPVAIKGEPGEPGSKGEPGTVDMKVVAEMVDAAVTHALGALPAPERGERGEPGEKGTPGSDGKDGLDGADGAGIADVLIDRDGGLVATFTDGRTKTLGQIVGKDGVDGIPGKDGETFGLDDFDIVPYDDGRTIKLCFTRGDTMHSFDLAFPVVLDRGVFVAERQYEQGDAVTWAGSLWIAQKETSAKPDTADSGWRLAVKRGRDGKDAK